MRIVGLTITFAAYATACAALSRTDEVAAPVLFPERWRSGLAAAEPSLQTQAIDGRTYVIRQALAVTFEAPFVYLLVGDERALLIDTGVGGEALRAEVDRLLDGRRDLGAPFPLVVMHSHGHGDHVGGDTLFADRPGTVIVGHRPEDVAAFFHIGRWPDEIASFDLGGRTLDVIPTPGHHPSHVTVFDRATRILFSGDAVYPGILRFRCDASAAYLASIDRLIAFADGHDVRWLLGGHIEMRAARGAYFQSPDARRDDERPLEMGPAVLRQIRDAVALMGARPRVEVHDDFVLFPHPADPQGLQPPDWCLP
jgi:glyoxylase-like metal-dependent hydrolase (beta-lactamase superfamily II)